MHYQISKRITGLPPYLFSELDRLVEEERRKGVEIIDMGVGDPDIFPPEIMIQELIDAVKRGESHSYPPYTGIMELNEAISIYFSERFGVHLDPEKEILPLSGSKEGLFHLPLINLNPLDKALVPDPAYPVYKNAVIFAGGIPENYYLRKENHFYLDIDEISDLLRSTNARLLFINHPHNPTGRVTTPDIMKGLVEICHREGVLLVNDAAYIEIYHGDPLHSLLEVDGAKEIAIEFHSFSKTFSCAGWRIGFAAGGEKVIDAFKKLKTNIDSGIFVPIQLGASKALIRWKEEGKRIREEFTRRVLLFDELFRKKGYRPMPPEATFYIWMDTEGISDVEFVTAFIKRYGIVSAPGSAFGEAGKGFVRFSTTVPEKGIRLAIERIKALPKMV